MESPGSPAWCVHECRRLIAKSWPSHQNGELNLDIIVERDQIRNAALVGQLARCPFHANAVIFQPFGERAHRGGVRRLPSSEGETIATLPRDDEALLAIVHPEHARRAGPIDLLHAKQPRCERAPVVELRRVDSDVTQCGNSVIAEAA